MIFFSNHVIQICLYCSEFVSEIYLILSILRNLVINDYVALKIALTQGSSVGSNDLYQRLSSLSIL